MRETGEMGSLLMRRKRPSGGRSISDGDEDNGQDMTVKERRGYRTELNYLQRDGFFSEADKCHS